jgi:hypothetical protein
VQQNLEAIGCSPAEPEPVDGDHKTNQRHAMKGGVTVTSDEIAALRADQLVEYDEQTERLMGVALSEVEQAGSLLEQAMVLRPLADRWVAFPGQGRKRLGELTGEELQTLEGYYRAAQAAAVRGLDRLEELTRPVRG